MPNLKIPLRASLLLLSLVISFHTEAQPTGQQTSEQAALSASEAGKTSEKSAIEQEYLVKARQNIEQYRKGDASVLFLDSESKPLKNVKIEVNQVSQDFLFGNIVWELTTMWKKDQYKTDIFKDKFKDLFNFAIIPFYWSAYELTAGKPQWQGNEAAINWCLENGITCKGHPLSWTGTSGTPDWLLRLPPDVATDLLKARIYDNVTGYKGRINIWDVVNEPVNTISWESALKDTANTDEIRYNVKGVTINQIAPWVENAYKWANRANPDGNYILNEFFTLAIPEVRDRFYDLIKELQKRNTPVKGIGIQAHEPREMWFSPVEMYKTLDKYKEFNLPIHITEFIPQSSGKAITGWREGTWNEDSQAEFAEQFYTLAFGHPSIVSITWWGLSDRDIWLEGGGLLDKEYNPKQVYTRLMKLIKQDWMTKNVNLTTDKKGQVNFRGFYGQYQIIISKPDGSKKTFDIHLGEKGLNKWTFNL
jgi:GH35 family endo-1,4-beta-xylanase